VFIYLISKFQKRFLNSSFYHRVSVYKNEFIIKDLHDAYKIRILFKEKGEKFKFSTEITFKKRKIGQRIDDIYERISKNSF